MSRGWFAFRDGELVELDPNYKPPEVNAPAILLDSMPPLMHPASGKIYESKSAFRKETKAHGLEEVGQAKGFAAKKESFSKENDIVKDLQQAKAMVDSGTAPLTEKDRAVCKAQNERIKNKV